MHWERGSSKGSVGKSGGGAAAQDEEGGCQQRSTVLLTTSPPLLGVCDRVVFLASSGEVVEGTHAELVDHADYAAVVLR